MSITNWENVYGWFSHGDSGLYEWAAQKFPDGSIFVEVGGFHGRSTLSMVEYLIKYKKKIDFFCVDHFKGSIEHQAGNANEDHCVVNNTLYQEYCKNIEPYKEYIQTMKMSSEEALLQFEDNSVDLVYIDASHEYENVTKDLYGWCKKVKNGGILSGHDWGWGSVQGAVRDFCAKNNLQVSAGQHGDSWHINIRG